MTTKRTEPSWREFERVVAMIEESAAPRGAAVTSPDRIRDLTTGEMREVDASIRYRLGTVDILITIECQKRSRKANDMWIEQLATKKQKLGAAKTIAVSEKGFTRAAYLTAKSHGIELRSLSEVTPQDVDDWFLPGDVIHAFPVVEKICCSVKFEGELNYIELGDPWELCFYHDLVASPFPAANFWAFYEMAHPRLFSTVPRDGTVTRVVFDIDATKPDLIPIPLGVNRGAASRLLIELDGSRKVVSDLRITLNVQINMVPFELADGAHHTYVGTDGLIAQHTRLKGEVFGMPVTVNLAARGDDVSGFTEFPSGARLEFGWMDSISLERTTCAFCDKPTKVEPQSVLPDFLLPPGVRAKERFLCSSCTQRFELLDAYAAKVWRYVPEDLTGTLHGVFSLGKINGTVVKLWLLSLIWRMGASQALKEVDLGEHASVMRGLIEDMNPGQPSQYPVACTALSCEGRRLEFFFTPQWDRNGGQRVLSVVLQGVLFTFLVGTNTSDGPQLVSDDTWIFPILDWRKVDFLVAAAFKEKAAAEKVHR